MIQRPGALAAVVAGVNHEIDIPVDLNVRVVGRRDAERAGVTGPTYVPNDRTVYFPWSFVEQSLDQLQTLPRFRDLSPDERAQFLTEAMTFVLYHELAHGLIDVLDVPVVTSQEAVADDFAAIFAIAAGRGGAVIPLRIVDLDEADAKDEGIPTLERYADDHGFSRQRAIDTLCLVYGSAPRRFAGLVQSNELPESRAQICPFTYRNDLRNWRRLLGRWLTHKGRCARCPTEDPPMAGPAAMSSRCSPRLTGMSDDTSTPTTLSNIGVAMFAVSDQDAALAFYTKKLGFEVRADMRFGEQDEMRWLEVAPPGSQARLALNPPMGGPPGGGSIGVETTDVLGEHRAGRAPSAASTSIRSPCRRPALRCSSCFATPMATTSPWWRRHPPPRRALSSLNGGVSWEPRCVVIDEEAGDELGPSAGTRLLEDGLEVVLHGVGRHVEAIRDVACRQPAGDEFGDGAFSVGEPVGGHDHRCEVRGPGRLEVDGDPRIGAVAEERTMDEHPLLVGRAHSAPGRGRPDRPRRGGRRQRARRAAGRRRWREARASVRRSIAKLDGAIGRE